jgi:16S rRNA (uracil1498-N3)-methyltransferase
LHTERSVAKTNSAVIDRLRRAAVEASKQCGRNWLMEILPPAEFSVWLNPTGYDQRWLAHPTGGRPLERGQRVPGAATIGVGPEGGFSDGEVTMATEAGCRLLSLGRHTLRVETAALAAAAQWEQWE